MSDNMESSPDFGGGALNGIVKAVVYIAKFCAFFTNPTTRIYALIACVVPLFETGRAMWTQLFLKIDQLSVESLGNANFQPLGFANYLLPLDWLCVQLVVWFGVYVLCSSIRIIKSFIPTVA